MKTTSSVPSNKEVENNIKNEHSNKVIDLITAEINSYETGSLTLTDKVSFSQYQTIQNILTHQNKGFLTELASGQADDREFYDIITPMVETAVSNIDLDTDNLDAYTDNANYLAHEYLAKSLLKNFLRQTNHGVVLNENAYQFIDDGNLIARKVDNKGEIYKSVLPQNLFVIDQSAESLEDTAVIEKNIMNQTQVRDMKSWANKEKVYELCNVGENDNIPYYEVFYRYGELSKERLNNVIKEVHGTDFKPQEEDKSNFVQALTIMVKAKQGVKDETGVETVGVLVFAEELKPETIKITKRLEVKRYKPYEEAHLGKFSGRFWRQGYREIGMPYQNRANELGNQIRQAMKLASKMVFWSKDTSVAGKNILSAIKNGQIILATDLQLLNNIFPNLSLYSEEWNRNITEAEKSLKAFEIASGENLPSSTSATAISVQNQAVGKYYNFKREKFGLFLASVFKRWVIPELLKIDTQEVIELIGDATYLEEIVDAHINGWLIQNYLKVVALSGGMVSKADFEQLKELKKQELLKQPKLYAEITKEFFKDVELYVGINPTGEPFNKQARITNSLSLLQYELNPMIQQNPEAMDTLRKIKVMLGLPVKRTQVANQQPVNSGNQGMPATTGNMPMKEPSLQNNNGDNANMI
jgi:hypothetical protein